MPKIVGAIIKQNLFRYVLERRIILSLSYCRS